MTQPLPERPPLDAARLAALAPRWRIEVLPETASTNAVCTERARAGEAEGLVVTTEHQYAGRGRLDRGWEMPPRSAIAMSILVRSDLPPARWPWIPLATGLAVATVLSGHGARVKWPNDVLVEDRKLCGILVERVETDRGPAAVVGIGLNVSLTRAELPIPTATSVMLETGLEPDRTELLEAILHTLEVDLALLGADPDRLRERYRELSATIGRAVRVELPSGATLEGTATGIEADGRLVVASGEEAHLVAAGDVVHARLA